ncbi:condensation domain-containing protein, partial [Dyella mobilis]
MTSSDFTLEGLDKSQVENLIALAKERRLQRKQKRDSSIPIVSREGHLPLSFAQRRLWLLAQLDGVSATYHIPMALHLHGALDVPAWQRSLDALFARHEAL